MKKIISVRDILNKSLFFVSLKITFLIAIALIPLEKAHSESPSADESVRQYTFSIRSLGVSVAVVKMTDHNEGDKGILSVHAKSTTAGKILFPIDNYYYVEYKGDYLPLFYQKDIDQRRFTLEKSVFFDYDDKKTHIIRDTGRNTIESYDKARDFFSSLLYISDTLASGSNATNMNIDNNPGNTASIIVYANNNFWSAECNFYMSDIVAGKDADVYQIVFNKLTDNETSRSDVLTNNLTREGDNLYLWFTVDVPRIPVKAEFKSSPVSVYWHLETD